MLPENIKISHQEIQVEVLFLSTLKTTTTTFTVDEVLATHVLSSLSPLSIQSQQPAEEVVEWQPYLALPYLRGGQVVTPAQR